MRTLFVTKFISSMALSSARGQEGYQRYRLDLDIEEDPADTIQIEETCDTETLLLGRTTYEGLPPPGPTATATSQTSQHHAEDGRATPR